jgi:tetratricopeptide (TPR) repeat protein
MNQQNAESTASAKPPSGISEAKQKGRYLRLTFRGDLLDRVEFRFAEKWVTPYLQRGDERFPLNWPDVEVAFSLCFLDYIIWVRSKKSGVFLFGVEAADVGFAKQLSSAIYQTTHKIHQVFFGENLKGKNEEMFVTHLIFPKVPGISKSGKGKSTLALAVSNIFLPPDCIEIFWDSERTGNSKRIDDLGTIQELAKQIRISQTPPILYHDAHNFSGYAVKESHNDLTKSGDQRTAAHSASCPLLDTAKGQIEPPVGDFVGRITQQGELISKIISGAKTEVGIAMIHGMPGVGKSEMALMIAKKLKGEFPDAQLSIKLNGDDDKSSRTADALALAIRSMKGLALELPPDLDFLRHIYLSSLNETKSLVLVDNARDTSDVGWFVPPDGCAMIVTSRGKIPLPRNSSVSIHLDELEPDKAKELLVSICSRITLPIAEQICRYCGCLPLAIRAAGNYLDTTPGVMPSEYLELLKDEHHRLELIGNQGVPIGIEASFNLSYHRLPEKTAQVFRFLSLFHTRFDSAAEATVCDDQKNEHLHYLHRQALVNYESSSRRYYLHDLMRLFASNYFAREQQSEVAAARFAEHYLALYERAEALFDSDLNNLKAGAKLFVQEQTAILAGWRWCVTKRNTNPTAARLCCRFGEAGAYLSGNFILPADRVELYAATLDAARILRDTKSEVIALRRLARAHYDSGKHLQESLELLQQSFKLAVTIGDVQQQAVALSHLGRVEMRERKIKDALRTHIHAVHLARISNDLDSQMVSLGHLGSTYTDLGESPQAICCYNASLKLARRLRKSRNEAIALGGLGRAYDKTDKPKALKYFEDCLKLAKEIDDLKTVNTVTLNLGRYFLQTDPKRALKYFQRSLELNREQGNRKREGGALYDSGLALKAMGDKDDAIRAFSESLRIARDALDYIGEGKALEQLCYIYGKSPATTYRALILGEAAVRIYQKKAQTWVYRLQPKIKNWRQTLKRPSKRL